MTGSLLLGRGPHAVLELGGRVQHLPAAPRDLEPDRADRCLDGLHLALEALTQHLAVAHADRRRLREQDAGNFVRGAPAGATTVTSVPGRFFFIWTGRIEHVERAGGVEPVHQRTEQLRVHVVDLALHASRSAPPTPPTSASPTSTRSTLG